MYKIEEVKDKINLELNKIQFDGDLGDIGNSIGYAIAQYFEEDGFDIGYDKDSFFSGLNHGISLIDGTHG